MKWFTVVVIVLLGVGFISISDLYSQVAKVKELNDRVQVLNDLNDYYARRVRSLEIMTGLSGSVFDPFGVDRGKATLSWYSNSDPSAKIRSSEERILDIKQQVAKSIGGMSDPDYIPRVKTLSDRIDALVINSPIDRIKELEKIMTENGLTRSPTLEERVQGLEDDTKQESRFRDLEHSVDLLEEGQRSISNETERLDSYYGDSASQLTSRIEALEWTLRKR